METVILVVHVVIALAVIGFVLLQQGKGADAGASLGGGASQTVFGGQGSGNFLTRTTAILTTVFFITSLALAIIAKQKADGLTDGNFLENLISDEVESVESPSSGISDDGIPQVEEPADIEASDIPVIEEDVPVVPEN